ncbi:hypothetical protein ABZT16_07140 [Streptomyces flaveolus]|uniref:Secreted protein n=1 Tax=Streptomyces flaveolus TaxID=67297 RepID=A0ABV3A3U4_9ACTN|nr:hypothetical protein ACZ91_21145 [Streptomyces regensis]
MDGWVPYVVVFGFFSGVLGLLTWLARVIRRRGGAGAGVGAALASYEEAFRATSHAAHHEIRAQADRRSPAESPDGTRRRPGRAR